jgi:SAM-dependent methyltransferase
MFQQTSDQAISYLNAKKSIDDRSLNAHVWSELWQHLPEPPLRILELGAGIGTMIERMLERGKLRQASYTALDLNSSVITAAQRRLSRWAADHKLKVDPSENTLALHGDDLNLKVTFLKGDVTGDLKDQVGAEWDLLMGHALLDLVDIPTVLPSLLALIRPGGLFYFTLTFDGLTHFEPGIDADLDRRIIRHYHQTMDERRYMDQPAGASQSGRRLLGELSRLGADILAAGASDWVIHPQENGYPDQDATFLEMILDTIEHALGEHGELPQEDLDLWLRKRRQQLADAELIYLAHQLDVCGHPPSNRAQG